MPQTFYMKCGGKVVNKRPNIAVLPAFWAANASASFYGYT
jgi:hypothetical protein